MGGAQYFVTFIDDNSRKVWVQTMRTKDETFEAFKRFKALAENQCGCRVKALRSDNGGEYNSAKFKKYLAEHGICAQTTAPYTPEQNGVSERMNRTLVECARTMLHAQDMNYTYWAEAVMTAAYIRNRRAA
jgi:transposase InsO family protein